MKKILIFYGSYGGGHLSAARSIKEYIEKNYPSVQVQMLDCMEYISKTINKVTIKAYFNIAKNAKWAWGKIYYGSSRGPLFSITNNSQKILALKLKKLLQEVSPDLIISTHPFSSQMCAYLKNKYKFSYKIATILTDYAPHVQWLMYPEQVNYFFVAYDKMKLELIDHGIPEEKIFATGIPLSNKFLAHYDKEKVLEEFNLSPNKKTILFFAGGEYGFGKDKTLNILRTIITSFPNFQIFAVAGKNKKIQNHFEELVKENNVSSSVKILPYTNKVPELMSVSDLVVTKPRWTYNNRKFSFWFTHYRN